MVFWVKTIIDEARPAAAADEAGQLDLPASASPEHRVGQEQGQPADETAEADQELAAYNAYLAKLNEQVQGHGRWHGLR